MKIITITANDPGISWGPAIHFLELWNSIAKNNPDVEIEGMAPSWSNHNPILPVEFRLRLISVPAIAKGRQVLYDVVAAWRVFRHARPSDIVYLRPGQFHLFLTIVLSLRRFCLVVELNGLGVDDAVSARRSTLFRNFAFWQEGALVRLASGVISVSQGITDTVRTIYKPKGKLLTLKNGVGTHFFGNCVFKNQPETNLKKRLSILYVGTFTPWDGAARIIELAQEFPMVDFYFVGDGPARRSIEANSLSNMKFVGKVSYTDLPVHYQNADAGIVLYEVQRHQRVHLSSLKTLEYIASGLPVFTTNVPGQEFIAQLGCGVLADEKNLVEIFRRFLSNLQHYRRNAMEKRTYIYQNYSWASVANKTISFIQELNHPVRNQ